jgi:hypothetical protein
MSHRMAGRPEILFVYNVDLTLFALVSDFVHRLTAPETYPCRLCDLTYDRFTTEVCNRTNRPLSPTFPPGRRLA